MKPNRGFSLVELMVAMTLSLVVIGALLGMFQGTRTANRATTGISGLTDGGRFAIDFISASARNAGFYACNNVVRQTTILNAGATPMPFTFTQAVGGFEAANTGPTGSLTLATPPLTGDGSAADWTGGLDAALVALPAVGLPIKGSDALVIHSGRPGALPVYVTAIADGANNFNVNTLGTPAMQAGQIAAISDCAKTVTFEITGVGAGNIVHNVGGASPGNSASALPISFAIGAQVMPITTAVYYIGRGTDGDGALFRYDNYQNANGVFATTELVSDVENLQVLYGYDSTNTQIVSQYLTADLVPNWSQVMSVKIAVLAASPPNATQPPAAARTYNLLGTTVTAPVDTRLRQVFDATVTLRNAVN
jgi:type IV pilus assembly protein PilW